MKKLLCASLAAFLLICCIPLLTPAAEEAPGDFPDVSHFWYKLLPSDRYILTGYAGTANVLALPTSMSNDELTQIGAGAFCNQKKIKTVVIPSNFTTITGDIFSGCSALTDIYCLAASKPAGWHENWLGDCTATVHWGKSPFLSSGDWQSAASGKCGDDVTWTYTPKTDIIGSETTLTISGTGEMYNYTENGTPWKSVASRIDTVIIENGVTSVGENAFYRCTTIDKVQIAGSVRAVREYAFHSCFGLKELEIGNGVEHLEERSFAICTSLPSITLPDSVKTLGSYAFDYCTKVTSISIPDTLVDIGEGAFADTGVATYNEYKNGKYIPSRNNPYHILAGVIDEKATTFETHPDTKVLDNVFEGNEALTKITLNEGLCTIVPFAFYCCENLKTVNFPSTLERIGAQAFAVCRSLRFIRLPASLKYVGTHAFDTYSTSLLEINCDFEEIPSTWNLNWAGKTEYKLRLKEPAKEEPPTTENNTQQNTLTDEKNEDAVEEKPGVHPALIVVPIVSVVSIALIAGVVIFSVKKKK